MPPSRRSVLVAGSLALTQTWDTSSSLAPRRFEESGTDLERNDRGRLLTVVTKPRALSPIDYAPPDLVTWRESAYEFRAEVADQLERLFAAAKSDGVLLRVISGYRSYATQAETYRSWVRISGRASADATSAKPGHSEHQTGLAVDLDGADGACYLDACFGSSREGRWVARTAYRFGFILSYPKGYRERTGYVYEPWHLRYVGPAAATAMRDLDVALLADFTSLPYAAARLGWFLSKRLAGPSPTR